MSKLTESKERRVLDLTNVVKSKPLEGQVKVQGKRRTLDLTDAEEESRALNAVKQDFKVPEALSVSEQKWEDVAEGLEKVPNWSETDAKDTPTDLEGEFSPEEYPSVMSQFEMDSLPSELVEKLKSNAKEMYGSEDIRYKETVPNELEKVSVADMVKSYESAPYLSKISESIGIPVSELVVYTRPSDVKSKENNGGEMFIVSPLERRTLEEKEEFHHLLAQKMSREVFKEATTRFDSDDEVTLDDVKGLVERMGETEKKEIPLYNHSYKDVISNGELEEQVIQDYISGIATNTITNRYNISTGTLYAFLNRRGISKRGLGGQSKIAIKMAHVLDNEFLLGSILKDYKDGVQLATIYEKWNIHKNGLYYLLDVTATPRRSKA